MSIDRDPTTSSPDPDLVTEETNPTPPESPDGNEESE